MSLAALWKQNTKQSGRLTLQCLPMSFGQSVCENVDGQQRRLWKKGSALELQRYGPYRYILKDIARKLLYLIKRDVKHAR